jgi:adenylate kinase
MHQTIIFGPPGVGKGTQAALVAEKLSLKHFSTGDILRKAVQDETELGKKAKEIMDKGELVPDDIMIGIVREALAGVKEGNGFILDGFPRTLKQAQSLDEIFNELGFNNVKILYLTADDSEIVTRLLKRGRSDDTEETILHRLKVYNDATSPVIDYYKDKCPIIEIDGVGGVEEINGKIVESIGP